ncbi:MAG TPA: hypothetical protein VJX23_04870 [Candidatus Binataceae bacterium]|nr:hypothetical protein [Candidatus Binataceae bacterium]
MGWCKRVLPVCLAVALLVQAGAVSSSRAVDVSTYWDQLAPSVQAFLLSNGLTESDVVNRLADVARWAGFTQPQMTAMLSSGGPLGNPQNAFWPAFVAFVNATKTEGMVAGGLGRLAARFLIRASLVLVVAFVSYKLAYACGQVALQYIDPDQALLDADTANALSWTLQNALASGRWQLRPGLTPEQATKALLDNVKQNRCPYLANLIVPASPVSAQPPPQQTSACPPASSGENARFLADQYYSVYQRMLSTKGPTDPSTIDAQRMADCYRGQAQQLP